MLSRALSVPLILGLVCFLPAVIAAQPGNGVRDTAYWLQLVLTCYAGARLATMILSTQGGGCSRASSGCSCTSRWAWRRSPRW
ncbi:hypothetical protein SGRIM128S_05638 [Streptomyces griseomycini]